LREVIDRYAEGIFDMNNDKLAFSVSKLEATIAQGELYEGDFELYSQGGTEYHAFVYTSDMRLVCRNDEIRSQRETIHYVFDTTGLEAGDIVKGDIQVVSDMGEYYLSFAFAISYGIIESSMGTVRNLFHFANQAQANWDEAVDLFYSDKFAQIFEGNDRAHRGKYRGFSQKSGDMQAVDDFLVSVNKKRPVELSLDRTSFEFNEVTETLRCDVQLHKSTWGNINIELSTDAPFITLEKDKLTRSDFVGNTHNLVFFIMDDKLHEGLNFGRINIIGATSEISITIQARQRARVNALRIERREKRSLIAKLVKQYIAFRMKKTNVAAWVRESMKIVERMNSLDEKNPVSRLFQAQLLLSQRRDNEAKWILDHVEKEMNIAEADSEAYAYYLYLTTLLSRDEKEIDAVTEKIRIMYSENPESIEIFWTLLYIDEDLSVSSERRIEAIEEMIGRGKHSPILYIEAYNYYASNPAKLTRLSDFEVQVLYFAARNDRLSEELMGQIIYLASKLRGFDPLVYKLLRICYDMNPDMVTVEVICTLLIKGGVTGAEYFEWFSKGVECQLRITKLYEYYMYTLPEDYEGVIPKAVYMYFGFRNEMDWHRMARLYGNIIDNRRIHPDVFDSNRENMLIFAIEQIDQERMNNDVAKIIENVLDIDHIRPSQASHLAKLLFSNSVKCPDPNCARVILIQDQFEEIMTFPVDKGYAYPTIYTPNSILFYEDNSGRRSIVPEENVRKLFNEIIYLPAIRNCVDDNVYFSLYLAEGRKHYIVVDDKNVDFCRELADSDKVCERYKREIRMALLRYYYENDQISTMDDFLIHLDISILGQKDRADIVQFYVLRGMYDQAYQIISKYGVEEVSAKVCVRICTHMINQTDFQPDSLLLKLCYHSFKEGKYDETTLKYLVDNFAGLTKETRNVWKAAREFDIECYSIMERLIIQMLFTKTTVGEKDEIFEEYIKCGSTARVELAYLTYNSYEYFVRERLTDERVFSHIIHNYRLDEEINDACKLALLKYYAEEETKYSQKISDMLKEFIVEFLHRNMYFRFFQAFKDAVPELIEYMDKTVIEYRTSPLSRVVLHYILMDETSSEDEYHTEEMRNVFGGVFSREFVLFFGENLQYYITEEQGGREMLTHSDSISVSDTGLNAGESRYSILNDMVVSKTVSDEDTLLKLMQEYVEADSFARKVFTLR